MGYKLLDGTYVYPDVSRVGGLQSQGAEGEAIVGYCDPSATQDLESSGFCNVGGYCFVAKPHDQLLPVS